ncbi:DUF3604 domain-containing protein [Paenibacillus roseipurpureus]|uniref:DUF3604 domain-containing protein n=1 Tax=Paenibacillus roseopurpureus TaxID=2918901 RepID=A0AA96LKK8_9BACL|nr:DUF3604 domain-containing protein [Paenibacillus sp. MBLB1832]WNR43485.1 DUF3604 domain-containing protein [Paenibacillus sp. MBLB1832]
MDVITATEHVHPLHQSWAHMLQAGEFFHEPGKFIPLTSWEVNLPDGHINVYAKSTETEIAWSDISRDWDHVAEFDDPEDIITAVHVTMSPKHPSFDWNRAGKRLRLVEMLQERGCSESNEPDALWDINPDPNKLDGSVRTALAMGHRVGFVGGTDNHLGFPTRSNTVAGYVGMTGFISPELTRASIWDAMNNRHTYATSGVPILCHFTINGSLMGSELKLAPGERALAKLQLYGTAPIDRVELISNGKTVFTWEPHAWEVDQEVELELPS